MYKVSANIGREDAAREAIGTARELELFTALQSLVNAEARRIHRLYYCIKLRCMVMPTRFAFLKSVASKDEQQRQPVPKNFQEATDEAAWAYFEWLHEECEKCREPFFQQISSAVSALNMATFPADLGLSETAFPFKLWRGKERATVVRNATDVDLGEVLEHTTKGAIPPASTNQAGLGYSFVTAVNKDTFTVQPGGMRELVEVDRTKVKRCRGAGVLIPGPLKEAQRCGLV